MKISNVSIDNYYSGPSGYITINDEDTTIRHKLNEADTHEILALALRIFEKRQASIGQAIIEMAPPALIDLTAERD